MVVNRAGYAVDSNISSQSSGINVSQLRRLLQEAAHVQPRRRRPQERPVLVHPVDMVVIGPTYMDGLGGLGFPAADAGTIRGHMVWLVAGLIVLLVLYYLWYRQRSR
jgi:hypothetical protein